MCPRIRNFTSHQFRNALLFLFRGTRNNSGCFILLFIFCQIIRWCLFCLFICFVVVLLFCGILFVFIRLSVFSGIFFIYSGIGGEFFFFILFFRFIFSVFSGRSTFSTNRFQVCQRTFSVISFTRKCRLTFIYPIPRSLYNPAGVSKYCRIFIFYKRK